MSTHLITPTQQKILDQLLDDHSVIAKEESSVNADEYILRRDVEAILRAMLQTFGRE